MNPNARSFAFNPNAGGFVPPQLAQYQQQQQQQQGQQQQGDQAAGAQQYYQQGGYPQPQQQQGFNPGGANAYSQYQPGQGFIPQAQAQAYGGYNNNQYHQYNNNNNTGYNNNNRFPSNPSNRGARGGAASQSTSTRSSGLPPPPIPRAPLPNNPISGNQSDNTTVSSSTTDSPRKPVSLSIGGGPSSSSASKDSTSSSASDLPRKPVSLSIGGGSSTTSSSNDSAPRKPVSLSIGGGAKKPDAEPAATSAPAPAAVQIEKPSKATQDQESSSTAPTSVEPAQAGAVSALKSEEVPASTASSTDPNPATTSSTSSSPTPGSSSPRSESPIPGQTKKSSNVAKGSEKSATNAEKVLEEVKQVTDEETMKDLFGENAADLKSHLNVVFIGHVDAGKSTMGGNLLYLTGMVDKRTLEKYEKDAKEAGRESWYLSWALDSTQQEREKGKTVEVGRAFFETGKRRYTILDAPGHKSYVPHMISGAAQADVAILVISARKGEFETGFEKGGQTREHAMLVKTAGVQRLIVVVNKMDESTVGWAQERYEEIQGKLTPFLRSAGFNPKTDITYVPVSAFSGHNLKDPVPKEVCSWYSGPPLLTFLDDLALGDRKIQDPLKMPISEKYNDMGTVVVGKLEAGKVKKGDNLVLMPNKTQVEVLSIFNEQEEEVPAAISGDNIRIKLKGVDHEDVSVGFVLSDAKKPVHVVTQFEAQLAILDTKNIICAGYSAVMHIHTLAEEVQLKALLHYYDKKTGKKSRKPPQFAKKGMKIVALIETTAPVCLEKFSEHPQLGRFTLRDEGKTIGIGRVQKLIQSETDLPDVSKLSVEATAVTN